jgi:DNA-binding NarL/FixJ family response regulator
VAEYDFNRTSVQLRLLVIEPHASVRRLICESVTATEGLCLSGAAASIQELDCQTEEEIDIVLLNASLLQQEVAEVHELAARCPQASVVLFDSHAELAPLLEAIDLPVAGFLIFNHLATEDFQHALKVVAHGGAVIDPYTAQMLLEYLRDLHLPSTGEVEATARLTDREHEVLGLVREGLSNKEIAQQLGIGPGTVRAHLRSIFRKLEVSSRAGAVAHFRPRNARSFPAG